MSAACSDTRLLITYAINSTPKKCKPRSPNSNRLYLIATGKVLVALSLGSNAACILHRMFPPVFKLAIGAENFIDCH